MDEERRLIIRGLTIVLGIGIVALVVFGHIGPVATLLTWIVLQLIPRRRA